MTNVTKTGDDDIGVGGHRTHLSSVSKGVPEVSSSTFVKVVLDITWANARNLDQFFLKD